MFRIVITASAAVLLIGCSSMCEAFGAGDQGRRGGGGRHAADDVHLNPVIDNLTATVEGLTTINDRIYINPDDTHAFVRFIGPVEQNQPNDVDQLTTWKGTGAVEGPMDTGWEFVGMGKMELKDTAAGGLGTFFVWLPVYVLDNP